MSPAKSMPAAALGRSIGMTLFPTDLAPYAPSERARLLADFAEAGLEHVHCGDHVSFHDGYGWDGFVNAATFLALHDTLHVHLGLYLLPLRHPLAEEGGTPRPTWRHSIVVWCGLDRDREVARRAVAAEMKALYKIDYDDFARWCPAGSAEEVAEFVAPYLDAGARDVSLIARGRTLRDTIAQAAEVRRLLLRTNSAA